MKHRISLIFGIPNGYLPPLPAGWQYHASQKDYLQADDSAGNHYYIGRHYAYSAVRSPDGKKWWIQTDKPEKWVKLAP
jgi:hypothetical protein